MLESTSAPKTKAECCLQCGDLPIRPASRNKDFELQSRSWLCVLIPVYKLSANLYMGRHLLPARPSTLNEKTYNTRAIFPPLLVTMRTNPLATLTLLSRTMRTTPLQAASGSRRQTRALPRNGYQKYGTSNSPVKIADAKQWRQYLMPGGGGGMRSRNV